MLGIVPRVSLQVASGQLSSYAKTADSGHAMVREFCTACGTLLFLKGARFPEIVMFTVSSLDDPEAIRPGFQIWTVSQRSWSRIHADVQSFQRGALDEQGESP